MIDIMLIEQSSQVFRKFVIAEHVDRQVHGNRADDVLLFPGEMLFYHAPQCMVGQLGLDLLRCMPDLEIKR